MHANPDPRTPDPGPGAPDPVLPFGKYKGLACSRVPAAYREQLVDGGRIVIPMGGHRSEQALYVVERRGDKWRQKRSIGCVFVPLIGEDGWPD